MVNDWRKQFDDGGDPDAIPEVTIPAGELVEGAIPAAKLLALAGLAAEPAAEEAAGGPAPNAPASLAGWVSTQASQPVPANISSATAAPIQRERRLVRRRGGIGLPGGGGLMLLLFESMGRSCAGLVGGAGLRSGVQRFLVR